MAGDWIKMRVGLTTNPRVMRIAECLLDSSGYMDWAGLTFGLIGIPEQSEDQILEDRHNALRVTRYVTVTALLKFWGYANEHAKGEFIACLYPADVDEITGIPGFAEALEASGWAKFDKRGGVVLPNFGEHNTSMQARSGSAERQKRYRERVKNEAAGEGESTNQKRDVTRDGREEKRREEKEKSKTGTADAGAGSCPQTQIIALYHELLPELPPAREWPEANASQLRARWRSSPERQSLDWWRKFFGYVRESDFLMGRKTDFQASLMWLVKAANFAKVVNGNYENRGNA